MIATAIHYNESLLIDTLNWALFQLQMIAKEFVFLIIGRCVGIPGGTVWIRRTGYPIMVNSLLLYLRIKIHEAAQEIIAGNFVRALSSNSSPSSSDLLN